MEIAIWLFLFGVAAGLTVDPDLPTPPHGADFTISRIPMSEHVQPLADLEVTDHVVNLKRGNSKSLSAIYVQTMRKQSMDPLEGTLRLSVSVSQPIDLLSLTKSDIKNGTAQLTSVEAGQVFLAPVTIGGQNFEVVIDTGSSDPWVVQPNFTCADPQTSDVLPQQDCYFGASYDSSRSSTYSHIDNENFNITYSDGERLTGDMAFETFTMAGITVPRQKFAVVDYAAWFGDGYSAGLVGFAYGTLTSAYAGDDPSQDRRGGTLMYSPLFVSMYNLSLVAPVFSMAIDRDPNNGGVLALGGIPNVPHSPYWANVPIQSVGVFIGTTTPAYEFYEIKSDGFAVSANRNVQFNLYPNNNPKKRSLLNNGTTVIVDYGTSLVYAPNAVADAVAQAFQPPASYDADNDAYFVSCDANPPLFGVSIRKKIFFVNGLDMIVPAAEGRCLSGVQPNNGGLTILGDVWMKNVLAVFDIGAEQMRFASRQYYGLTSISKPAST